MEKFESKQNTSFSEAEKNWNTKGYLGVTAEDHQAIYSTPDQILTENPGKTLGELMTDAEIQEYIFETQKNIAKNNKESPHLANYNNSLKRNLEVTITYLKSIKRLPDNFELSTIE